MPHFFLRALCCFFLVFSTANASLTNPFSIETTVDYTHGDLKKASEAAVMKALPILVRRMVPQAYWAQIKSTLQTANRQAMLDTFTINSAKSTEQNLVIQLHFYPDRLKDFLAEARIPYSLSTQKTVLVVPILQVATPNDQRTLLWDDINPWRDAWVSQTSLLSAEDSLLLTLPANDEATQLLLPANTAWAATPETLQQLAEPYDVEGVLLAYANVAQSGERAQLAVQSRFIPTKNTQKSASAWELGQTLATETPIMRLKLPPNVPLQNVLLSGATKLRDSFADAGRMADLIPTDDIRRVTLMIEAQTVEELWQLEKIIENLPITKHLYPMIISLRMHYYDFVFYGEGTQVRRYLAEHGLTFSPSQEGWRLIKTGR